MIELRVLLDAKDLASAALGTIWGIRALTAEACTPVLPSAPAAPQRASRDCPTRSKNRIARARVAAAIIPSASTMRCAAGG